MKNLNPHMIGDKAVMELSKVELLMLKDALELLSTDALDNENDPKASVTSAMLLVTDNAIARLNHLKRLRGEVNEPL
jgi:hypothetical protein